MKMFMTKTVDIDKYNREEIVLINPNQISSVAARTRESGHVLIRMQNGDSILVQENIDSFWLKAEGDK